MVVLCLRIAKIKRIITYLIDDYRVLNVFLLLILFCNQINVFNSYPICSRHI